MKTTRIQKARAIVKNGLVTILQKNRNGFATNVYVPGSHGKRYEVIVRRNNGHLSTECMLETGYGHQECKGNRITICYHSWAAFIEVARASGNQITAICKTREDADLRARIGGKVIEVFSHQGGKSMFAVWDKA